MYRAYCLEEFDWNPEWKEQGEELYTILREATMDELQTFVADGEINGTQLQEDWFPKLDADVFISHSHSDRDIALSLAGWLAKTFGILAFVDSCVWGHSDELLRKLDDAYCWQPGSKTYNYALRNRSTSHVHMMLASALSQMIDATECVIFVSSPSAVAAESAVKKVHSPWINYELGMIEVIRKRPPSDHRKSIKKAAQKTITELAEKIPISYQPSFNSLTHINDKVLELWGDNWRAQREPKTAALDILYSLTDK